MGGSAGFSTSECGQVMMAVVRLLLLGTILLRSTASGPASAQSNNGVYTLLPAAVTGGVYPMPPGAYGEHASSVSQDPAVAARTREQAILLQLSVRGIANVRDWRQEGTVFIAEAEWYGEIVNLQVDAETGEIKQPERLKGTQVERMLRQQGWGPVGSVKRGGDTFIVKAERNGQIFDLMIDAKTGRIREAR